jgi:hypothetical protein
MCHFRDSAYDHFLSTYKTRDLTYVHRNSRGECKRVTLSDSFVVVVVVSFFFTFLF